MTRTTIDIDADVLLELKRRKELVGKPLGTLASELLAKALASESAGDAEGRRPKWEWHSQPMGALVDIDDKDAVAAILDGQ